MNSCNCKKCCDPCDKCNSCCGGGCRPARYDCNFSIEASPYDPTTWMVTTCGMMHKVKIPSISETDTTLSVNPTDATLRYDAERHTDVIAAAALSYAKE